MTDPKQDYEHQPHPGPSVPDWWTQGPTKPDTNTYYNRVDILDAHFWFANDYHDGQWSPLYARLCRIMSIHKPRRRAHGPATDNAKNIYANLERAQAG